MGATSRRQTHVELRGSGDSRLIELGFHEEKSRVLSFEEETFEQMCAANVEYKAPLGNLKQNLRKTCGDARTGGWIILGKSTSQQHKYCPRRHRQHRGR